MPVVPTARKYEPSARVAGSCLCGDVAFAATVVPRVVVNCYCSPCRRSRAAAFSSTLPVPREVFRWIRGADRVRNYTSAANTGAICGRHYTTDFCADCGSLAPSAPEGHAAAMLPAGAIDTPFTRLPAAHLHVGSKVTWYEINDAWPQFAELPPPERLTELFQ